VSRFYGSIQGERGEATRQGHHGIRGHLRGWNVGVAVECHPAPDGEGGAASDWAHASVTGGSGSYWDCTVARARSLPNGEVAVEVFGPTGDTLAVWRMTAGGALVEGSEVPA